MDRSTIMNLMKTATMTGLVVAVSSIGCGANDPLIPELQPAWAEPWSGEGPSEPAVTAGFAFVGDQAGSLWALDVATGATQWNVTLSARASRAPVFFGEQVYVVTEAGTVESLDRQTGDPVWSVPLGSEVFAGLAVSAGRVYVVTRAGVVSALAAANGNELWRVELGGEVVITPTANNDVLLVAGFDGNLTRFDSATGQIIWQVTPDPTYVIGTPIVSGDRIIVPGYEDAVYGISLTDGTTLWSRAIGNYLVALPAMGDTLVYFGSAEGPVYAIDPVDGMTMWVAREVLYGRQAILFPTGEHVLVVDKAGAVTWLDSDGLQVGVDDLQFDIAAGTLVDEMLVVSSTQSLHAFKVFGAR